MKSFTDCITDMSKQALYEFGTASEVNATALVEWSAASYQDGLFAGFITASVLYGVAGIGALWAICKHAEKEKKKKSEQNNN